MENLAERIRKKNFVAIGIETTGLRRDPEEGEMDNIIAISAVKVKKGRIKKKFFTYVACPKPLSEEISRLTGITEADLSGAPSVGEAILSLQDFCKGCFLVGHNIQFDLSFLNYYGATVGARFDGEIFDTLPLAKEVMQGELPNYRVSTLSAFFDIKAKDDATRQAKLFLELAKWQCFFAWLSCIKDFD